MAADNGTALLWPLPSLVNDFLHETVGCDANIVIQRLETDTHARRVSSVSLIVAFITAILDCILSVSRNCASAARASPLQSRRTVDEETVAKSRTILTCFMWLTAFAGCRVRLMKLVFGMLLSPETT